MHRQGPYPTGHGFWRMGPWVLGHISSSTTTTYLSISQHISASSSQKGPNLFSVSMTSSSMFGRHHLMTRASPMMTRYDKSIQRICMNIPSGSRFPMVTSLCSTLHCSKSRFHPIRLHVSSASTAWIFLVTALAAPFPAGLGSDIGDVYEASHCRMGLLILLVRNHVVLCLNCFSHWNVCQLAGGFKHF
jgi:hypothetical protein